MIQRRARLALASAMLLLSPLSGLSAQLAATSPQAATPLSLADALREADGRAYANRIATSATDAERAKARMPLKGILPSARIEGDFVRTTDPLGAFGSTLRQRLVTPASFVPERLNYPPATNNVHGGLVLEVPLLNGDAWTGWKAARAAADASSAWADWSAITTRTNVVRAYYGAILASEKVSMLEQARSAADAAVREVQAMVQQGLVTKADALQASVRVADVSAQLLSARNDALTARQQLGVLIGRSDGSAPTLPIALPADAPVRTLAERDTLAPMSPTRIASRSDVRAAGAGRLAADADRQRASSTMLPRLNGIARYDWNDPSALYGGPKNWTVGVMASWSIFGGNTELADRAGASARAASARAGQEATLAQGRVEADAARRGVAVALQRLDLADRSAEQSVEAFRLVEKRYAGGLATIAERLGAETQATSMALARAAARYALIDALAAYRQAIGADPAELTALDTAR